MSHRYRKKPVVIEAFQMTEQRRRDNSEWPNWLHEAWNKNNDELGAVFPRDYPHSDGSDTLIINNEHGWVSVGFGDWIIKGVKGELYPCDPLVFDQTYERVEP